MTQKIASKAVREARPVSPYLLAFRDELKSNSMNALGTISLGDLCIELCAGTTSAWALVRRPGRGGLAVRLAHSPGSTMKCHRFKQSGQTTTFDAETTSGTFAVKLRVDGLDLHRLRITVALTPASTLLMPFYPRDLYPLGRDDDPQDTIGRIEAAQRGLNSGLLYFHLDEPAFGSVLYFQNLTSLNPYFAATQTKPDGTVGGEWPEIGYLLPTPPQRGTPPPNQALARGEQVTISDAILIFRDQPGGDECENARLFVQMLGAVYTALDLPEPDYRDWIARAEQTLHDLDVSPKATIRHYGHRYAHPYTGSEYPDSMVQLSLLTSMREYTAWREKPANLEAEFAAGLEKFYDPKLKTIRRYLPNVGKDKDADAVDSWYLYHPLLNLARLALAGDDKARDLFLRSVDYGIKAAHHFEYKWPIQFKVTDFTIITAVAGADGQGQTDVGGIYAWVMLQAFEITQDQRFVLEAQAAIDAANGMRFSLNYQANLTAWGAAACLRLWRITNVHRYLEQSYVYLASFFHNAAIWESDIDGAAHYRNFLGVTCLQDAPYMAIYECFDSFAAFECYLRDSGPELEPAARMLISEYCKFALDRAWFYYPDALPADLLAAENRNGHIDRDLSFPLEDLYVDGQPAGQVGQEIYGAGAAFVFASRMFRPVAGASFHLFCDHFIMASERTGDRAISITLDGGETCLAALGIVRSGKAALPRCRLVSASGDAVRARKRASDRVEFRVPASGRYVLSWET
ncbi:hypothetical protein WG901_08265 [Novosphingobium sp. PS1R-30]|uniref:Uncharacterized protein n=1 Tax=Novosphingobium anseongense TaxID=3133436 RepID=A0ABU8RU65_9SPHN